MDINMTTYVGVGVLLILLEILVFMIIFYYINGRIQKTLNVLSKFLLKQYQDALTAKVDQRLAAEPPPAPVVEDPPAPPPEPITINPDDPLYAKILEEKNKSSQSVKPKKELSQAQKDALAKGNFALEKYRAEQKAKKSNPPPAPSTAAANDNDEELARLLESHGYKVTRGSKETLKSIAAQGGKDENA